MNSKQLKRFAFAVSFLLAGLYQGPARADYFCTGPNNTTYRCARTYNPPSEVNWAGVLGALALAAVGVAVANEVFSDDEDDPSATYSNTVKNRGDRDSDSDGPVDTGVGCFWGYKSTGTCVE